MATIPSIACVGIIGKNVIHPSFPPLAHTNAPQNNPLHITLFPSSPRNIPLLTPLQFSLLLSSTLDIFEARSKINVTSGGGLSGDFGLLHAVDERLAAYGFETNTGVRFVVVVDVMGRLVEGAGEEKKSVGLREGEMKLVSLMGFNRSL